MAKRSFWERLGRGVGYGWLKAKEVGQHLEEEAEARLELKVAREKAARLERRLGEEVARAALEEGAPAVDLQKEPFAGILEELGHLRRTIVELERARGGAQAATSGEEETAAGSDSPQEDAASGRGERDPPADRGSGPVSS